jgi:bifunctional DNase/RNase
VIEVVVAGLGRAAGGSGLLLLLKERAGHRIMPIGIGPFEAEAIALRLQNTPVPRPLTHDLLAQLLGRFEARLRRVEVSALAEGTFYAQLVLEQAGQQLEIDSRPSDAVALAVRAAAPIYVVETVFDQASLVLAEAAEPAAAAEPAEEPRTPVDESQLSVFREFIETLNTDDLDAGGTEPPA